jgi:hypothetical protein
LLFPDADVTRSDGYFSPFGIDDADTYAHRRSIAALGSDGGLGAVGLFFKDRLFQIR